MRALTLFLVLMVITVDANAQYMVWNDPVPVTDSLHNHANSSLDAGDPIGFWEGCYLVWEQWDDSLSTSIYARDLNTMESPFLLLSQPDVHFRNPQKISAEDSQMWFFLLYETDIYGNWDIYQVKYLKDGTVTAPEPVCATPADEYNFKWCNDILTWQRNDAILVSEYFPYYGFPLGSQPLVIDSGNCCRPVCSGFFCAWEKVVDTVSEVWYSHRDYSGGQYTWAPPDTVISCGNNTGLYMGSLTPNILLFQHKAGDYWRIKGYNLDNMEEYEMPDFPGYDNVNPGFLNLLLPVESYPFVCGFLTWASDTTGNAEIFVNEEFGYYPFYMNMSANTVPDRNPRLYAHYWYMARAYLFWESFRNDHWQIWMSWMDIPLGNAQNAEAGSHGEILVTPNPSFGFTTLTFSLPDMVSYQIQVVSVNGQRVWQYSCKPCAPGIQQVDWDGKGSDGMPVQPGLYLVQVISGSRLMTGKIMMQ